MGSVQFITYLSVSLTFPTTDQPCGLLPVQRVVLVLHPSPSRTGNVATLKRDLFSSGLGPWDYFRLRSSWSGVGRAVKPTRAEGSAGVRSRQDRFGRPTEHFCPSPSASSQIVRRSGSKDYPGGSVVRRPSSSPWSEDPRRQRSPETGHGLLTGNLILHPFDSIGL